MFLLGVTADSLTGTLPEVLFFAFQMTFAIITPALIVGAYVERVAFGFVLLFSTLWMLLCYAPVVHWIWGGGMLSDGGIFGETGARDFAGGIVVHETAGLAALVIAVMLGARRDRTKPPHNPGLCDDRRGDALGRLVRLQRRLATGRRRRRRDGADRHPYLGRHRLADLGAVGADQIRQGLARRPGDGHDRRPGLDHARPAASSARSRR